MLGSLTLDQLRVLVTISEAGSFSAAGRSLRRVQSAISQSVRKLEEIQDVKIFDRVDQKISLTPIGCVLIEQARVVIASVDRFEAIAAGIKSGLEPELTLVIDSLVPTQSLIESLRALQKTFPDLPVAVSTESLGGAERHLRAGSAALAVCLLLPTVPEDLMAYALMDLKLIAVVSRNHPLAKLRRKLQRSDLEDHIQLVLSQALERESDSPKYGVVGNRVWRFVDQTRRLDFLLGGFGWCKMPPDLVEPYLKSGRLVKLKIDDEGLSPSGSLPIYVAHARSRPLGRGGIWLLDDLRKRLAKKR